MHETTDRVKVVMTGLFVIPHVSWIFNFFIETDIFFVNLLELAQLSIGNMLINV